MRSMSNMINVLIFKKRTRLTNDIACLRVHVALGYATIHLRPKPGAVKRVIVSTV